MFEGVLLDFYGTVVHEDEVLIAEICDRILASAGEPATVADIANYWGHVFSASCIASHGEGFLTQRQLERRSLASTVDRFAADCDPNELAELLFDHWRSPALFEDAAAFLDAVELPVALISNIDRYDINAAISANRLRFDHVITSEDVRAYKPRPEPFAAGLAALGIGVGGALHVGDSVTSDVIGAGRMGIAVAWVNRTGKPRPDGARPTHTVSRLTDLLPVLS